MMYVRIRSFRTKGKMRSSILVSGLFIASILHGEGVYAETGRRALHVRSRNTKTDSDEHESWRGDPYRTKTDSDSQRNLSPLSCSKRHKECKREWRESCFVKKRCTAVITEYDIDCMKQCAKAARGSCEREYLECERTEENRAIIESGECPEQSIDCLCPENRENRVGGVDPSCSLVWCSAGDGIDCSYQCEECIPPGFNYTSNCNALVRECPPGNCPQSDLANAEPVWCGRFLCSSDCQYASRECISPFFELTQCQYGNGTQVVEDQCPPEKNTTECDCNATDDSVCNTGSRECTYCSWDCIPTDQALPNGLDTRYCNVVDQPIPI